MPGIVISDPSRPGTASSTSTIFLPWRVCGLQQQPNDAASTDSRRVLYTINDSAQKVFHLAILRREREHITIHLRNVVVNSGNSKKRFRRIRVKLNKYDVNTLAYVGEMEFMSSNMESPNFINHNTI